MKIAVTGSRGLIGSAVTAELLKKGCIVFGIDNDARKKYLGNAGSTKELHLPFEGSANFHSFDFDLRQKKKVHEFFAAHAFDGIIHCAGQPSHPKSLDFPLVDFEANAQVTLALLECTRLYSPRATFIFTSSNKVYGDNPNLIPYKELKTRFEYKNTYIRGVSETMSVDQATHTPFGVSKLAADTYVQEYARSYGLRTVVLRLGCVTGKHHASVKEQGFLSFLVKSIINEVPYEVIGFGGKQVRDQLAAKDLAQAIWEILRSKQSADVYNLGGGKENSISVLEAIRLVETHAHRKAILRFNAQTRLGDHRCYYTDNTKFLSHYPKWSVRTSIESMITEIVSYEMH